MTRKLCLLVFLMVNVLALSAQSGVTKTSKAHRHGLLLNSNITLAGSEIDFRPGLGLGYTYFAEKYNVKSLIEYSQWSVPKGDFTKGEFRFNFRYEYERYLNQWFSIGAFASPEFRYHEDFYPDNDPRNNSEVTYALGLGLSPKIYLLTDHYYLSLGFDLPLIEAGYFQGDGPDPEWEEPDTFKMGAGARLFSKELRAVVSFGYRF